MMYIEAEKKWMKLHFDQSQTNPIEVSICVTSRKQYINPLLKSMGDMLIVLPELLERLLHEVYKSFKGTIYEKTPEEVRLMYSLASIELKDDNKTFWLVLEPGDVASIFNHFWRFTMVEGKLTWSNLP